METLSIVIGIVSVLVALLALTRRKLYVAIGLLIGSFGLGVCLHHQQVLLGILWLGSTLLAWILAPLLGTKFDPLLLRMRASGIIGYWSDGEGAEALATMNHRFPKARRIDFIGIDHLVALRMAAPGLAEALHQGGCEVNLTIARPDGDLMVEEALMRSPGLDPALDPERLVTKVRSQRDNNIEAVEVLQEIGVQAKEGLPSDQRGRSCIRVRRFNTQLRQSFVILDRKWAWMSPNAPPHLTLQLPAFELVHTEDGCLLDRMLDHVDRLYAVCKPELEITI